ncbi:MAG: hypothetical protein ACW99Q_14430 [Candidatus Kariarchaeaceae archaeon]|jgi:hypothetical protein
MTWTQKVGSEDRTQEIALGLFLTNSMLILAISMITIAEWHVLGKYTILLIFGLYIILTSFINTYEKSGSIDLLKQSNLNTVDLNSSDKQNIDFYYDFQIKLLILNIILFLAILVSQINEFAILGIYPILIFTGQFIHFLINIHDYDIERVVKRIAYIMLILGFFLGFQPWIDLEYFVWITINTSLGVGLILLHSSLISSENIKKKNEIKTVKIAN